MESAAELRAALASSPWQAILSDWRLPGFSALDALAICRESGLDLPFLIVSGSFEDELVAAAARAGIRDWVSKDRLERLPGFGGTRHPKTEPGLKPDPRAGPPSQAAKPRAATSRRPLCC